MIPKLRKATQSDLEWLEPFYESLMRSYVELTHDWKPHVFRDTFDPSVTSIIQLDGEDIGMFKVHRQLECIYLADIQIHPQHQNQGIGAHLIQGLIDEASAIEIPVKLRVLKGNPARGLYEKLGFKVDQELDVSTQLIFQPVSI